MAAVSSYNMQSILNTVDNGLGRWQSFAGKATKPLLQYTLSPADRKKEDTETTWGKVGRVAVRLLLNICLTPALLLSGAAKLVEKGVEFGSAAKIKISDYFSQKERQLERVD